MAEGSSVSSIGRWSRLFRPLAALGMIVGVTVIAGTVAGATGGASVQLSSTSATATRSTYTTSFASPGALAASSGTITLAGPSGTVFSSNGCLYTIYDAKTTQTTVCPAASTSAGSSSVTVTTGYKIAAGDPVVVTAEGVTNTSAGAYTLDVTTSAGGSLTAPFTLTAATAVTTLVFSANSTSADAAGVAYSTSFTTTNGLTPYQSQIVITGPSGMVFSSTSCSVYDATTQRSNSCLLTVSNGNTATVTSTIPVASGNPITVSLQGTNPSNAGDETVSLHTTSDPVTASTTFDVTAPTAVSALSLTASSKDATATQVTDAVSFTPTNGLTQNVSTITVTAPAGTALPGDSCDYSVYDTMTKQDQGCPETTVSAGGNAATVTTGITIAAGARTTVTVNGVTNPPSAVKGSLTVATTSDPTAASVADAITAPTKVEYPSFSASAKAESATGVSYDMRFTTVGGLTAQFSQFTLAAPTGTTFVSTESSCNDYVVTDLTDDQSAGCLTASASGSTVTITTSITIAPGSSVEVEANDVTNTSSTGDHTITFSTTSNPVAVTENLALTAPTKVKDFAFSANSDSAKATHVRYTARFTAVGGLDPTFSAITLTGAPGTIFPPDTRCIYDVVDDTTGQNDGCPSATVSSGKVTVRPGIDVNPGDTVTLTIDDVSNPTTAGKHAVKLSTSSDAVAVSAKFDVVAEKPVKDLKFSSTSYAAGAKEVTYRFSFVVTGGIVADTSTVTVTGTTATATGLTFPTPDGGCGTYPDLNSTTGAGWTCSGASPSTTGTSVTITPDEDATTGATFIITINGVTNPIHPGTFHLKFHTSFDPKPIVIPITLTPPTSVEHPAFTPSSTSATATEVSYDVTFVADGGLTANRSTITLTGPSGTVFPSGPTCGGYVVTDTTTGVNGSCMGVQLGDGDATVVLTTPIDVKPGDQVSVVANGVSNPTAAGSGALSVSTTSDQVAKSEPFVVTAPTKVTHPSLKVTTGASKDTYTIGFTATNGLTEGFSTLTVTAPAGVVLPPGGCGTYTFTDTTDGAGGGCESVSLLGTGSTAVITLPINVRPGDAVSVVVLTVGGSAAAKVTLSTSSDPVTVPS
jgi:hypothetical protein